MDVRLECGFWNLKREDGLDLATHGNVDEDDNEVLVDCSM